MRAYKYLILLLLISISCQSQNIYTEKEKSFIALFNGFITYIKTTAGIADSIQIRHLTEKYLFVNDRAPSKEKIEILKSQVKTFYGFLQKDNLIENISVIPIRLTDDKSVYSNLTDFQKENTLVYFDKRIPKKILGYILFIPQVATKVPATRIWSWTLAYQFGRYMFRSVTGEDGYEYIFTPK